VAALTLRGAPLATAFASGVRVNTLTPNTSTAGTLRCINVVNFIRLVESRFPMLNFAHAQLGQENTFPWDQQAQAYPMQMAKLAKLRDEGEVHVETMEGSGRRFKQAFKQTPAQAQVQLVDPLCPASPRLDKAWW